LAVDASWAVDPSQVAVASYSTAAFAIAASSSAATAGTWPLAASSSTVVAAGTWQRPASVPWLQCPFSRSLACHSPFGQSSNWLVGQLQFYLLYLLHQASRCS